MAVLVVKFGFYGGPFCALLLLSTGCLEQTVDLREAGDEASPQGDPACGPDERRDPGTGQCAPCTRTEPPPLERCPCDFVSRPQLFPFCDDEFADYECRPCPPNGSVAACTAFHPDGSVRNCAQLAACCGQIAEGSTPCCSMGQTLRCGAGGTGQFPNVFECVSNACCEAPCANDYDCDSFQSCVDSRCTPGCDTQTSYCDVSCTCVEGGVTPL